ncbi:MAG: hypothetical protein COU51_04780 [Parcubacteria group bacterium CG10_big_fil_rev_8_21_14_0_10_36_14]|nr:MAG: hypothetical protein COU51_04780 [Parcubacteria group bacterium CG10_big_fil_rev_8_21_14_0_10_36_14]
MSKNFSPIQGEFRKKLEGSPLLELARELTKEAESKRPKKNRIEEIKDRLLEEVLKESKKESLAKKRIDILREALSEPEEKLEVTDDMIIGSEDIEDEKTRKDNLSKKRTEILQASLKKPEKQPLKKSAESIDSNFDFSETDIDDEYEWFSPGEVPSQKDNILAKLEKLWVRPNKETNPQKMLADLNKLDVDEKKEVIEVQGRIIDNSLKKNMERDGVSYEDYESSSQNLAIMDQRLQRIENTLLSKYGFDVIKGGLFKKFNIRRKLDPADTEEFDVLLKQYKTTDTAYKTHLKKHNKKYAEVVDRLFPKDTTRIYLGGFSIKK